ncbi:MAG TPA: ABC transporter ATP-binding protein [Symbiobacteriaceae bacterium]|nr:ABC transporter ATP-binding protein [Symbiobacteriaceae bacterium]
MEVTVKALSKQYGKLAAVDGIDLTIRDGELFTMLGPSGCGKTTTLRCIVGLELPDGGSIHFGPDEVTRLPANMRPCGMVFQNYALYPHMSVFDNVAYGLKVRLFKQGNLLDKVRVLAGRMGGTSRRPEIKQAVEAALDMVELSGLGGRNPSQLSGGQQQRVALARALVTQPKVLLLDEPLGALDAKLRVRVREEIRAIQKRLGITTVYVTHDQEEAMSISDRIAVMNGGKVVQMDTPEQIYRRPANAFVADFLGLANILPGRPAAGGFALESGRVVTVANAPAEATRLMIRPEAVRLLDAPDGTLPNLFEGTVVDKVFFGSLARVRVDCAGLTLIADVPDPTERNLAGPGQPVYLQLPPDRVQLLPG